MSAPESLRAEVLAALLSASWPDGDTSGFPTRRVAEMLADALLASPALAAHVRAKQDRRDRPYAHGDHAVNIIPPERRNKVDDHDRECAGWEDCFCFGYHNPYRQEET